MIKPKTIINIHGKSLFNFEKVVLNQMINNHHTFAITVDYGSVESVGSYNLDTSKEWLGKSVVINFDETDFLGIITHVQLQHDNGFDGKILISGYSKTILLENGPHMSSWLHKNLDTIVKDTLSAAGLTGQVKSVFTSPIAYQAQYKENHFQFIQRLAKQYNEWLYYDGVQLIFGKPPLKPAVTIEYGADMNTLNIAIEAIASTTSAFSYNSLSDVKDESQSRGRAAGLNELGSYAFDTSKELFSINTQDHLATRAENKDQIDTFVGNQQASKVATANVLSGTSTKQGLTVGTVIKVTGAQRGVESFEVKNYGEYIITKIKHTATGSSEYSNEFEAISSGVAILPVPEVRLPEASSQIATVLSNEDPNQKGRVEVQFQWQKHEQKTSWIRVMTPDAGSSAGHAQNRGHVFIPEVGDQVMVGFRYNDPNRPFVMGSLFHGSNGAGGKADNNYKSIITKGGHILEFNDTEKQESITITDKNKNTIFIDTVNKNIKIKALNKIELTANDITLNASNNLSFNSAKNTEFNVSNNFVINVMTKLLIFTPYLKQTVSGFMHLFSGKALINSLNSISIESKEVQALGTEKIFIHSDKKAIINSKGIAEVHGKKKNSFTNKALSVVAKASEEMSLAVVEFRTQQGTYKGEFGFDWLRIDDNRLTTEPKYEDIIDGGYNDGVTNLSKTKAFTNLKTEYDSVPIKPKNAPSTMASHYYVPYLNLYSEHISSGLGNNDNVEAPYEATLRVLVEIEEDIDKLEFEYDKNIFTIDKPILSDKTACAKKESVNKTIKITCDKLINSKERGLISLYAYPKGSLAKTPSEQILLRKLAGRINVCRNDEGFRKKKKFVSVSVIMDIDGSSLTTGKFSLSEKSMLRKALYQCMAHVELDAVTITLDLSSDANFKILTDAAGVKTYGKFIYKKKIHDTMKLSDGQIHQDHADIYKYVQDLFLKKNPTYKNYFTLFSFNENTFDSYVYRTPHPTAAGYDIEHSGAVCGQVQDIGVNNVFLFLDINGSKRDDSTMAHEVLHGYGLQHTHEDEVLNIDIDREYTYKEGKTDNFMAYEVISKTTWKWQWDVLKKYI